MITVLVATRNRSDILARTLEAFGRLECPGEPWKLVVIDNGSTDATPEVLRRFRDRLPLTSLREPVAGLSRAFNVGLSSIEEGLVVTTADDVLPEPGWLARITAAAESHRDYSIFGGPILPYWESEPPQWVLQWVALDACYAVLDGMDDGPCPHHRVFGGNMAIRSKVFRRGHRFDDGLGPNGSRAYPTGNESELLKRLRAEGHKCWHCKEAVVRHVIPARHMTEAWLFQRARNHGRGQYLVPAHGPSPRPGASAWFLPRLAGQIAAGFGHALAAGVGGRREARFRALWSTHYRLGIALEHCHALRRSWRRKAKIARPPGPAA